MNPFGRSAHCQYCDRLEPHSPYEDGLVECRNWLSDEVDDLHAQLAEVTKERDALRSTLEKIRDDPHQSYEHDVTPALSQAQRQYQIGVSDGHRCAANVAREALCDVLAELEGNEAR